MKRVGRGEVVGGVRSALLSLRSGWILSDRVGTRKNACRHAAFYSPEPGPGACGDGKAASSRRTPKSRMRNSSLEFDGIGEANGAGLQDGAIEREGAGELGDDALQNADVLHLRVGVVGGHHAAFAQLDGFDEHGAQANRASRPGALREAGDATDNDVGPKPAAIHTEAGNGTIGGDEKRQDVEPLRPREFDELRGTADGGFHEGARFGTIPRMAIHGGTAIGIERALQPKKFRVAASGDDAVVMHDDDFAVVRQTHEGHFGLREQLPRKTLHRVTPDFRNMHGGDWMRWQGGNVQEYSAIAW